MSDEPSFKDLLRDAFEAQRSVPEVATVHVEHLDGTVAPVVGFVSEIEDDGLVAAAEARGYAKAVADAAALQAERDAALASLAAEREQTARTRAVVEAVPALFGLWQAWLDSTSVEPTKEQMDAGYVQLMDMESSGDVYLCVCTCHAAAGGEGGTDG